MSTSDSKHSLVSMPPKQGSIPQKKVGQRLVTMKKQEKNAGQSRSVTSAADTVGPMRSKSENSGLSTISTSTASKKPMGAPLGKQYLSKSHENLTVHQKKKLSLLPDRSKLNNTNTAATATTNNTTTATTTTTTTSTKTDSIKTSNKENVLKEKEKNVVFAKPSKVLKSSTTSTIRKASSTQNLDKSSAANKNASHGTKIQSMKRAHSSQSVTKDKSLRKRTSAPADVMAYNAELLANFEREKKIQEGRISELIRITEGRKAEIEKLKYEIKNLKEQIPPCDLKEEFELLRRQNKSLQDRLKELGIPMEQITDSEKLLKEASVQISSLKTESLNDLNIPSSLSCDSLSNLESLRDPLMHHALDCSASVSASEPGLTLADLCRTPEHPSELSFDNVPWDKQSNKSSDAMSEVSVACLTERILQMEETHYSTNEELQATLQELGDLQDMVNELTEENEKLADERGVLLESLCTQTEKLEHCRTQLEHLKSLLINGSHVNSSERETQLIDLLKGASIEREEMLRKQDEYGHELQMAVNENREVQDIADALRDRIHLLQAEIDTLTEDKKSTEKYVSELKQTVSNDQIEINRYKTMLENEKSKVQELEQYQQAHNKSDLEELLHTTRQEKDKLEAKLTDIQESKALGECEIEKLRDILVLKDEELKGLKNNSKTKISELESKMVELQMERGNIQQEKEHLRDNIDQLEQDCDRYHDDVKKGNTKIQELQQEIKEMNRQRVFLESELNEAHHKHEEESEEWKQFQKDLQVAVVIANEFRTETQEDMERLTSENAALKEKVKSLQSQLGKANDEQDRLKLRTWDERSSKPILSSAELKGKMINTVDRELVALREGRRMDSKNQTMSVKNLIRSIEDQVKSGGSSIHSSEGSSRRSSLEGPLSPVIDAPDGSVSPTPSDNTAQGSSELPLKSALKRPAVEKLSPLQPLGTTFEKNKDFKPTPQGTNKNEAEISSKVSPSISSILSNRSNSRRNSGVCTEIERKEMAAKDPLVGLAKQMGGSKRNALLKWCQMKTLSYTGVDITNFSSSWNDGLAFCALMHCYLPEMIPYDELTAEDKRRNFTLSFSAAESVNIMSNLNINDMVAMERPDWQAVMAYVTSIYKYFEVDSKS